MKRFLVSLALAVLVALPVHAHPGPRIWISIDNGKIVTYAGAYPPGDPSNYARLRVFTQMMVNQGRGVWDTDFPGFQRVPGGAIPNGTTFRYNITGPLLWFNDEDESVCPFFETVAAQFAPGVVPQMAVVNELFQIKITGAGFVMGDAAFSYNGAAGDHNHLTYTLLGDGMTPVVAPDGIYALPLQFTTNGATASDTFYLLLGKNASAMELAEAAAVVLNTPILPDLDCDGDVDIDDHALLLDCMNGPTTAHAALDYCERADFDAESHVDLYEYAILQRCHSGDGQSPDPSCAP